MAGLPAGPGHVDDRGGVGPRLRPPVHPVGLGFSPELDSNLALMSLMHAYGASVQDDGGNVGHRPARHGGGRPGGAMEIYRGRQ